MADRPVLVTVPDVPIAEVGTWQASTGEVTFTAEDFAAAVSAQDDPAVRTPVLKLGHIDPRFDGEPAVGRIVNLRTSEDGMTLYGDLTGVPSWLADILASAFPDRSIEGFFNWRTATGSTHQFVVTGLALLGVSAPAVETLDDIAALFGVQPDPVAAASQGHGDAVAVTLEGKETARMADPRRVAAGVNTEDVRRAYYDGPGGGWEWWVREIQIDPSQLIVSNDDTGALYRVPYEIDGDEVVFSDPVEVAVEYVDKPAAANASRVVFASREESRPNESPPAGQKGGSEVDPKLLRTQLGLPEDASDEDVLAKAEELRTAAETPNPGGPVPQPEPAPAPEPEPQPQPTADLPEGLVLIDQTKLAELETAAAAGVQARERQRRDDRDRYLQAAHEAGKFPPERIGYWRDYYDRDEVGAKAFLDKVAANAAVPLNEIGHATDADAAHLGDEAYPANWLPEVAARREETHA